MGNEPSSATLNGMHQTARLPSWEAGRATYVQVKNLGAGEAKVRVQAQGNQGTFDVTIAGNGVEAFSRDFGGCFVLYTTIAHCHVEITSS